MRGWLASPLTGPILLAAILVLDQLTKSLILDALFTGEAIRVTGFFNIVLVWNPGISFGMLGGVGRAGPWPILLLTLAIGVGLLVWLWRERRVMPRLAIWAVLAGAIGNLVDRTRFGAVVDFLDLHAFGHHWPAFNVADSAICIGAAVLVLDGLAGSSRPLGKVERRS